MRNSIKIMLLSGVAYFAFDAIVFANSIGLDLVNNNGKVKIQNSETLNLGTAFTLEAWIWADSYGLSEYGYYQEFIYKWSAGYSGQRSYFLGMASDKLRLAINTQGPAEYTRVVYSNQTLPLHQWTHVAGVYSNSELTLFINGVKDSAVTSVSGNPFAGTAPVFIGAAGPDTNAYEAFDGKMDEIRISNFARYSNSFQVPTSPFSYDNNTLVLMHLDEGVGTATENFGSFIGDGLLVNGAKWGEGAPIPEPATLLLLGVGGLVLRKRYAHCSW